MLLSQASLEINDRISNDQLNITTRSSTRDSIGRDILLSTHMHAHNNNM